MYELYGYWRSQAAYRVRIALAIKGQDWNEQLFDLLKGEQYEGPVTRHNPQHAVPVLLNGPLVLTQSMAIMEYLNEIYPSPPLLPGDPFLRSRVRAFALMAVADCHPLVVPRVRARLNEQFGASVDDIKNWVDHWQSLVLDAMEQALSARQASTPFCFGGTPGIADICLAAHVAGCQNSDTPVDGFKHVIAIHARCQALEAFSANHPKVLRDHGPRT